MPTLPRAADEVRTWCMCECCRAQCSCAFWLGQNEALFSPALEARIDQWRRVSEASAPTVQWLRRLLHRVRLHRVNLMRKHFPEPDFITYDPDDGDTPVTFSVHWVGGAFWFCDVSDGTVHLVAKDKDRLAQHDDSALLPDLAATLQ